jgi:hypothetical protein
MRPQKRNLEARGLSKAFCRIHPEQKSPREAPQNASQKRCQMHGKEIVQLYHLLLLC